MEDNKWTEDMIKEFLAYKEFQKIQEKAYAENFVHPLDEDRKNKTLSQTENEKLWNEIRNKKK